MTRPFSTTLEDLCASAESVAQGVIASHAGDVDKTCSWPAHGLGALAEAGVTGLTAPVHVGGHGQGLLGVAALAEVIGKACSSTALCFGMHCVATAVIAAKATRYQEERYLAPIAAGDHITTLALSESGSGANLFIPEARTHREENAFVVSGVKQFVTSGGHADSYVISTLSSSNSVAGEFDCLVVDKDSPGMSWSQPWRGFGMRGNSSCQLTLDNARIPLDSLLGAEGEQPWYVFEVILPFFLTAMAGTYLGIADAALDAAIAHVRSRQHAHSGQPLSELQTIQHRMGELWAAVRRARCLLYDAAALGDSGDPRAMASIFSCKAEIADTAVSVTNEAMTLCGGIAYAENSVLARLLRDARASHVMAPTTDMLRIWTGRSILGLPLL